jgi:hypothetical protein
MDWIWSAIYLIFEVDSKQFVKTPTFLKACNFLFNARFYKALPLSSLFLLLMLMGKHPVVAQGAWNPANADFSYPRTLLRQSEVPAMQNYIATNPEGSTLYEALYDGNDGNNVTDFVTLGGRRSAAHMAKNAAFIYLLDRKPVSGGWDTLTVAEANFWLNKALYHLNNINIDVEIYPTFDNYIWRADELADNAVAFDLLKGAGVPNSFLEAGRSRIHRFATNFHTQVAINTFGLGLTSLHVDNYTLRSCSSLGIAALVLNDADSSDTDGQPQKWIQTALYNIDNVLWRASNRQSEPGQIGGYSEGPHYLRFGMQHNLQFFHALANFLPDTTFTVTFDGHTRNVRHPWHDPNYDLLWEWLARIRMPDGRNPQLEDCFAVTHATDLAMAEQGRFKWPFHFSRFDPAAPVSLLAQLHHSSDDMIADYLAAMTPFAADTFPLLQVLPMSGNIVMRSGWDSTSTYLHMSAKNGRTRTSANGHNQTDVTSFILHARGQELALSPGYVKYDRRTEVAGASHHNLILVNGTGPPDASTGFAGDADGFAEHDFALRDMFYAEVRTSYNSANIVRKPLFIRRDYFLITDEFARGTAADFEWRLHAHGLENGDSTSGTFALDSLGQAGTWTKNGVHLRTVVTARGGISLIGRATDVNELRYDSLEHHTVLKATQASTSGSAFLAALIPYENDSPQVQLLCAPTCDAIKIERGGHRDIAMLGTTVQASASGLSGDLNAAAKMTYYSEDQAGAFAQFFLETGNLLTKGTDTIVWASTAADWALEKLDSNNYEGQAGAAGMLYLYDLGFTPGSVLGWNVVQSWQWNANLGRLEIQFSGPGHFTILRDVVIGNNATLAQQSWVVYPNPSNGKVQVHTALKSGRVRVTDINGRCIMDRTFEGQDLNLDFTTHAPGVYLLQLEDAEGKFLGVEKLVIE